ncbi:MAG: prepilin-type N-terminal cleavage/methylation domain-containing protein [Candidatus Eremiobacterota bacterium]
MRNKKALSLLEAIISIAIFSLLLTVCNVILNRALVASSHGKATTAAGNEAIKGISWFISDMAETSASSVTMLDSSNNKINLPYTSSAVIKVSHISLLSGFDKSTLKIEYTDSFPPLIKWKYYVLYFLKPYKNDTYTLYRKLYRDDVAYANAFKKFYPVPMSATDLQSNATTGGTEEFKERTVAKNIYSLELVEQSGNRCTLKVTASESARNVVAVRSTRSFTIVMNNTIKAK